MNVNTTSGRLTAPLPWDQEKSEDRRDWEHHPRMQLDPNSVCQDQARRFRINSEVLLECKQDMETGQLPRITIERLI